MIDRPLGKEKWDLFAGVYRAEILNSSLFSSVVHLIPKR